MTTSVAEVVAPGRAALTRITDDALGVSVQALLRNLLRRDPDVPPLRTVGLTGCTGGAGVSTVAARLAVEATLAGQDPVLLVDAHLARPAAHKLLGVKPVPGLAEALHDGTPLSHVVQVSAIPRLSVLVAGRGDDPAAFAESPGLAGLLETVKDEFALVVCDLPPVGGRSPTAALAAHLDGLVLVLEAERTPLEAARLGKDRLESCARLLGVVLNKRRRYLPAWFDRIP
jgi:Mrp family chromosome partitioning ATPase